jgi:arylformamidase
VQIKEIVDLSHELFDGMPNIAEGAVLFSPTYTFGMLSTLSQGRLAAEGKQILLPEHCGTHVDAPRHFDKDAMTAAQIPLEQLVVPGHLLDFTAKGAGDLIEIADLEAAEQASGEAIGPDRAVILWTGCDKDWGTPGFEMERAGVPEDAAQWLVDRGVRLVCTDLIGIDDPAKWWWPSHGVWLHQGVPMVQQLRNLDKLVGKRFLFVALPLPMRDSTGSPVRAVALVTG